jgi:polyhydroxybutyrate depolymerase
MAGLAVQVGCSVACSTSTLDALTAKPQSDAATSDATTNDAEVRSDRAGDEPGVCRGAGLGPGDTNETIQVGSLTRTYFLHVPSSYDGTRSVPLLVDFHFLGNSGAQEMHVSPYPTLTDPEGVIIAFPDGLAGPGGTAWNVGPCCVSKDVDDVAFAKALVAQLQSKACIDPKRVYAVGYGLGGGFSHYLGCHAGDVFAAIAPVGFDLLKENVDDCKPSRPVTVVSIREVSDTFAPYDGGTFSVVPNMSMTLLGAEATFAKWAEIDRCTGAPTAADSNGCSTYQNCGGGGEVVLCAKQAGLPTLDNGGIAWPILKRHPMP